MIKCPFCKESYFQLLYQTSTCAYYPLIYKDGKWSQNGKNQITNHCRCLMCGGEFSYEEGEKVK